MIIWNMKRHYAFTVDDIFCCDIYMLSHVILLVIHISPWYLQYANIVKCANISSVSSCNSEVFCFRNLTKYFSTIGLILSYFQVISIYFFENTFIFRIVFIFPFLVGIITNLNCVHNQICSKKLCGVLFKIQLTINLHTHKNETVLIL